MTEEASARSISEEVVKRLRRASRPLVCNISNRHIHLCREDLEKLFGTGAELSLLRPLMQPGEFASTRLVDAMGPKGIIKGIRVLGPLRKSTQLEISRTDTFRLGIKAPLRDSGNIAGTPGIRLLGPAGSVMTAEGLIVARRHIHMTPADAAVYFLEDGETVRVRTEGPRSIILNNVVVRVSDRYALECHVDTDEANACDLKNGSLVYIA